ncbi:ATP-binding cassette domain-containing protein [Treponema pedis]
MSLAVKAGEVCVITGESGCGKSTLLGYKRIVQRILQR